MAKDPVATPPRIRIRLQDAFGNPIKNTHYKIGWRTPNGDAHILPEPPVRRTDDKGILEEPVPSGATIGGVLVFIQDTLIWVFRIKITDVKPPTSVEGTKARLSNLGFMALESVDDKIDDLLLRGLQRFRTAIDFWGDDVWSRLEQEHER